MKAFGVILYVCLMVGIGYLSMKRTRTVSDFFLGNRSIGPWVSAFAYGTTYFSAVLFIGYAGKVGWGFGLSSLWIVAGNTLIGTFLAWMVLARRTREMTSRLNAMTMPEFLAARYDSRAMKIVAALIIFIFLVPYSASVYMGLSHFFEAAFGIPFAWALAGMAGLTSLYLIMGGYFAITLADFVQGLVMIAGVIFLVFFVITDPHVGGLREGIQRLAAINPQLTKPVGPPGWLPLLSLVILTSLGPWGLPQMVQKFYSIKNEQAIPHAVAVSTIFALLMTFGAYFTGAFGRLFFNNQMPLVNGKPNPDMIMPNIVTIALPELIGVVILLLVLAASMSTLASLVLVSSSSIAIDLVQGVLSPQMEKKRVMLLLRILCLVFIAFSVYLALKPTIILVLMSLSWGTVAGAFLGPYLYGLFWPGATRAGAWAGMLAGLFTSLGLAWYYKMDAGVIPTIGSAAMLFPLLVVPIVSSLTRGFSQEHLNKVFGRMEPIPTVKSGKGLVTNDLG
ncbi:MAG: sodium:solute symporter family protein [Bacillota bacterium]